MLVEVVVSELVGPDAILHFDLSTPEVQMDVLRVLDDSRETGRTSSRFTARVGSGLLRSETGPTTLHVDIRLLHFFDCETTDRIGA